MRTTVDLPPAVHSRALELARRRHQSMSAVVGELAARGLASMGEPMSIGVDEVTGLPTVTVGHALVTADEVAELLDDE